MQIRKRGGSVAKTVREVSAFLQGPSGLSAANRPFNVTSPTLPGTGGIARFRLTPDSAPILPLLRHHVLGVLTSIEQHLSRTMTLLPRSPSDDVSSYTSVYTPSDVAPQQATIATLHGNQQRGVSTRELPDAVDVQPMRPPPPRPSAFASPRLDGPVPQQVRPNRLYLFLCHTRSKNLPARLPTYLLTHSHHQQLMTEY